MGGMKLIDMGDWVAAIIHGTGKRFTAYRVRSGDLGRFLLGDEA